MTESIYLESSFHDILIKLTMISVVAVCIFLFFVLFQHWQSIRKTKTQQLNQSKIEMRLYILGNMAANIIHEINNPVQLLSTTLWNIEDGLQKNAPCDAKIFRHDLSAMSRATNRIIEIIKETKKIAASSATTNKENVFVKQLIDDALMACQSAIDHAKVSIDIQNSLDHSASIYTSPVQFTQVEINLIQNSIESMLSASSDNSRWIKISIQKNGSQQVNIDFVDSGPGVPVEFQEKIFEPFFSTKSRNQSMGLGLSISKSIITALNGNLTLTSKDGVACFRVSVPNE